jgi:hypothetical protein
MASPADQRLLELLEKWLVSLELHTKYSALDDASYWKIQPWIEHQRPSRWILDLAKQKTTTLKSQVEERIKSGDTQFSDSLELMIFLANLVGSEHIERFIPMAEMQNERQLTPAERAPEGAITGTREMPKFVPEKRPTANSSGNSQVARAERKAGAGARASGKSTGKSPAKPSLKSAEQSARTAGDAAAAVAVAANAVAADAAATSAAQADDGPAHAAREQVIADAVRLVQWGRKWFELPELVARMAGRPPLAEVRRILKENKPAIDAKAKN